MKKAKSLFSRLPDGYLERDGERIKADPAFVELAIRGWDIKRAMDDFKKELEAINKQLMQIGEGAAIEIPGEVRVTVAERKSLKIVDVEKVKALLGPRFEDLVHERVSYKPHAKLGEIAADGDSPLGEAMRGAITIDTSTVISYRAAK